MLVETEQTVRSHSDYWVSALTHTAVPLLVNGGWADFFGSPNIFRKLLDS